MVYNTTHSYTHIRIYKYTNTLIHSYTHIRIYKYTNIRIYEYSHTVIYSYTHTLIHSYTHTQIQTKRPITLTITPLCRRITPSHSHHAHTPFIVYILTFTLRPNRLYVLLCLPRSYFPLPFLPFLPSQSLYLLLYLRLYPHVPFRMPMLVSTVHIRMCS